MCGIAGVYGKEITINQIKDCQVDLKDRGPDNSDYYKKDNITLIHTRLSILDLSSLGNQPMRDELSGTILIYNGEIYNFNELQKKIDPSLNETNDTRVLLKLFIKYGKDCFKMLRGMFAIAIWQEKEKKLTLVRDRFGIKPLYYAFVKNVFYFGSETKVINTLGVDKNLDNKSIKNYLVNGILENNNNTMFENVKTLEPGTILSINNKGLTKETYWSVHNYSYQKIKKNEIYESLRDKLDEVIKLHLLSDVNVGLTLSSGIDSQILLKYLLKFKTEVTSYTYGYDEKIYDESKFVENNYENNQIKKFNCILNPKNLIHELSEAIEYFQTPLGGLGTLSLYHLMKKVKKTGTKVILSGEGGDEIFFGYKYYFYAYLLDLKNNNKLNEFHNEIYEWEKKTGEDLNESKTNSYLLEDKIYGSLAPDGTQLSSKSLEGDFLKDVSLEGIEVYKKNHLMNINFLDITKKKLPKLLMFQDRCSMSNSVESRVPFLDHELYDLIRSVDTSHHIKNGVLKNMLRNELDSSLTNNDEKKYVAAPQREWLKNDLYEEINEIILDGYLVKNKIINKNIFFDNYKKYKESNILGNSFFIWKVLNLEILYNKL